MDTDKEYFNTKGGERGVAQSLVNAFVFLGVLCVSAVGL